MTARGNRCATRCPGLMGSVADGSTYTAPVVETGSSLHSSRIVNAMTSPLSRRPAPMVAHPAGLTKRAGAQESRAGVATGARPHGGPLGGSSPPGAMEGTSTPLEIRQLTDVLRCNLQQ